MAGCFYTPDEIDHMPMQDAMSLLELWRERPPTHEILTAVHRIVVAPPPAEGDPSGIGALIARAPDGQVKIGAGS